MDHFGVEFPSQSEEVNQKKIESYRYRYGVDHPMHSDEFKSGLKDVFIEKYGVDNPSQIDEVKQKKIETEKLHFGMPFCQTSDFRQLARENLTKLHIAQSSNGDPDYPAIGLYERPFLDELQKYTNYKIIRNDQLIGYFPDGYIKELNLVIEFDEDHHNWTYQKNIDVQKDIDYQKSKLVVLRITKRDWDNHKDDCINRFKNVCDEIGTP